MKRPADFQVVALVVLMVAFVVIVFASGCPSAAGAVPCEVQANRPRKPPQAPPVQAPPVKTAPRVVLPAVTVDRTHRDRIEVYGFKGGLRVGYYLPADASAATVTATADRLERELPAWTPPPPQPAPAPVSVVPLPYTVPPAALCAGGT